MTTITKTKVRPRSTAKQRPPMEETPAEMLSRPAWTHEERLQHIQALGQRIETHIKYMCKIGSNTGTSTEVREKSVTIFYERLVMMELQLSRIQQEVELG